MYPELFRKNANLGKRHEVSAKWWRGHFHETIDRVGTMEDFALLLIIVKPTKWVS